MFDIVLKNVILMILVVLICHFLIQSKLLDMPLPLSQEILTPIVTPTVTATVTATVTHPVQTPRDAQLRELYDYVFSEDSRKELDAYYQSAPRPDIATGSIDCADPVNALSNELCISSIDKHLRERTKTPQYTTRQSGHLEVIAEYEKESELNGGLLDGKQLQGFSSFSDDYATL